MEMIIDYKTLKATIDELVEHNQTHLVNELLEILANNEIQKPEKHNRKEDINTSRFNVDLNDDQITEIIDFAFKLCVTCKHVFVIGSGAGEIW